MNTPPAVLRWFERQVGRTVTLRDGRKVTLQVIDACGGELSLCIEVPGSGLVWIGLDELKPADSTARWPRRFSLG